MRRLIAIAAAVLLLVGCVPTRPVPERSADDLAAQTDRFLAVQWAYLGFTPDSTRPAVDVERYVRVEQQAVILRECVAESGYDIEGPPTAQQAEAIYVCNARFPVDPALFGFHGDAELDFIYDYYVESLVPCLAGFGVEPRRMASRDEFHDPVDTLFLWSPYDGLRIDQQERDFLATACPSMPPEFRE